MLGNNKHFYPSQDDKDAEDEEEEEELAGEKSGERGCDPENGGLKEHEDMLGGRSWDLKGREVTKPAAIVVGRQRADRTQRPSNQGNRGYAPIQFPHPQTNKQIPNVFNQYHPGLTALQKRRAPMERSMTSVAPMEDSYPTMMVFRIGIPDIKQTVGACIQTHTR